MDVAKLIDAFPAKTTWVSCVVDTGSAEWVGIGFGDQRAADHTTLNPASGLLVFNNTRACG